jgi:chromatin remodeling complex protein RSC6
MPRVKKSETATETVQTTATPSSAPVQKVKKVAKEAAPAATSAPAATPAVVKKEKVVSAKKEKAVAAAPATPAVVATSTEEPAAAQETASATSEFTDFMGKLQQLTNLCNSLKSEFRLLEKKASKDLKTVAKANAKRKRKNVARAPSGFVKPTLISAELAAFLGKTAGTEMARTEVTREINSYIREHQLQDKSNGRVINADTKLSLLLKIPAGEELTYFNLQRYMSPHFTKTTPVAVATA